MLAILVCLSGFGLAPTQAAGIVADQSTHNFGKTPTGNRLNHTFRMSASDTSPGYQLKVAYSSCGCAGVKLSADRLEAGQSCELEVSINSLTAAAGPQSWKVELEASPLDGSGKLVRLEFFLKAELYDAVRVQPPAVAVTTANDFEQTFEIIDQRARRCRVTSAECNIPNSQVRLESKPDSANQFVQFRLSPQAPPGSYAGEIVLATDDESLPTLQIPVRIVKRDPRTPVAYPAHAELNMGQNQSRASILIQVRSGDRVPEVKEVLPSHKQLSVTHARSGPFLTLRVGVACQQPPEQCDGIGTVTVQFADDKVPPVVVPVRWQRGE